jgi:hypothetical protein
MGRIYYQTSDIATFTSGDVIELNCAATDIILLHSLHVKPQATADEAFNVVLARASGAGTGGNTTGIDPAPALVGDAAFGGTYREAATGAATGLTELSRWAVSTLAGLDVIWTPETRPVVPPSGRIVIKVEDAISSATLEWNIIFEEIG